MDSEVRHELERNTLEIKLVEFAEWMRARAKLIAVVAAGVVVAWGGWRYMRASALAQRQAAWNDFFSGDFDEVVKKHPASDAARYAKLRIAETAFKEAQSNLLGNREQALKDFDKAIGQYDSVAADSGAPAALRRTALFSKAVAIECRGAPEKATEAYKAVAQQYKDSTEGRAAEARVKELARKSAANFYRQLVDYKPAAAATPTKMPGDDLNLDFLKGGSGAGSGVIPPPPVAPPVLGKDAPPNPKDVPAPPKMDPKTDAKSATKTPPPPPSSDLPPPGAFAPKGDAKTPPARKDESKTPPAPPTGKEETKK